MQNTLDALFRTITLPEANAALQDRNSFSALTHYRIFSDVLSQLHEQRDVLVPLVTLGNKQYSVESRGALVNTMVIWLNEAKAMFPELAPQPQPQFAGVFAQDPDQEGMAMPSAVPHNAVVR